MADEIRKVRQKLVPMKQRTARGYRVSPGRPRAGAPARTGNRQTLPLLPGKKSPSGVHAGNVAVKRRSPFDFSVANIDLAEAQDIELMYDWLTQTSPDVSLAVWTAMNLADSGWRISVKNPVAPTAGAEKNLVAIEDSEATAMAYSWLRRSGSFVDADFPGAVGNENSYVRSLFRDGALKGAGASETVFSADFTDAEFVSFDPMTVEFRVDPEHRGKFLIGQRQVGAELGWMQLNPNLVTYVSLDGTLYGDSPMAPALHQLPYWQRFYADLQVYLHNAAYGFTDASVNTETLKEMWAGLKESEKKEWNNDFFSWALDVAQQMAEAYTVEKDPDVVLPHLDIMTLESKASTAASFPVEEFRSALKRETINSVKTPAALLNEKSGGDKAFNQMQIGAYEAFLISLQKLAKSIIERSLLVAFRGVGYEKEVIVEMTFNPVQVSDRLTESQAEQLELLNAIKKRDENFISQNEAARIVTGTGALGSAPLSLGADPDGPSAPAEEFLVARQNAKEEPAGAGSGPSFGGNKKGSDTDPTEDNRV